MVPGRDEAVGQAAVGVEAAVVGVEEQIVTQAPVIHGPGGEPDARAVAVSGPAAEHPGAVIALDGGARRGGRAGPTLLVDGNRPEERWRRGVERGPASHVELDGAPEDVRSVQHRRQAPIEGHLVDGRERNHRHVGPVVPTDGQGDAIEEDRDLAVLGTAQVGLRLTARVCPDLHGGHAAQELFHGGRRHDPGRVEGNLDGARPAGRRDRPRNFDSQGTETDDLRRVLGGHA